MARVYAVARHEAPGGVVYQVYVTGKKRRFIGKSIVVKDGAVNDAHAQVAAYEATLK